MLIFNFLTVAASFTPNDKYLILKDFKYLLKLEFIPNKRNKNKGVLKERNNNGLYLTREKGKTFLEFKFHKPIFQERKKTQVFKLVKRVGDNSYNLVAKKNCVTYLHESKHLILSPCENTANQIFVYEVDSRQKGVEVQTQEPQEKPVQQEIKKRTKRSLDSFEEDNKEPNKKETNKKESNKKLEEPTVEKKQENPTKEESFTALRKDVFNNANAISIDEDSDSEEAKITADDLNALNVRNDYNSQKLGSLAFKDLKGGPKTFYDTMMNLERQSPNFYDRYETLYNLNPYLPKKQLQNRFGQGSNYKKFFQKSQNRRNNTKSSTTSKTNFGF